MRTSQPRWRCAVGALAIVLTSAVEIKDLGTTKIDLPEEARKKLS